MRLSSFFSEIRSLFPRIRSLFLKDEEEEGVVIVEREEFAREMRDKFRGNTALLKAIEEGMNRKAERHEYVSLAD